MIKFDTARRNYPGCMPMPVRYTNNRPCFHNVNHRNVSAGHGTGRMVNVEWSVRQRRTNGIIATYNGILVGQLEI